MSKTRDCLVKWLRHMREMTDGSDMAVVMSKRTLDLHFGALVGDDDDEFPRLKLVLAGDLQEDGVEVRGKNGIITRGNLPSRRKSES
jgi:hypothetical protein